MKGLLRNIWLGLLAVAAVSTTGCSKDEPVQPPTNPTVEISNVQATSSSVTFTLTATDAAKITYSVTLLENGSVAKEGTIEGKLTSTETASGLQADKEYQISATAIGSDGNKSEIKTMKVTTNGKASVAFVGKIVPSITGAKVTLAPTNATAFFWTCYKQGETPADKSTWTKIEGNETTTVPITGLTSETTYLVAAYATNAEGDSEAVTSDPFTTSKSLDIKIVATAYKAVMYFDFDKTKYSGVFNTFGLIDLGPTGNYPNPEDNTNEEEGFIPNMPYTSAADLFKDYYRGTGVAGKYYEFTGFVRTEPVVMPITWPMTSETGEYALLTACVDLDGNIIESSAQEHKVVIPKTDVFGTGSVNAEFVNVTPDFATINVELKYSGTPSFYFLTAFSAEEMTSAGYKSPEKYVTECYGTNLLGGLQIFGEEMQSNKYLANGNMTALLDGCKVGTTYYVAAGAVDMDGKFGKMVFKMVQTRKMEYDPSVTLNVEKVAQTDFSASFKLTPANAEKMLGIMVSDSDFSNPVDWGGYDGKIQNVAETMVRRGDDFKLNVVDGIYVIQNIMLAQEDAKYHFFAMPISADGKLGTCQQVEFTTVKTREVNGNATIAISVNDKKVTITPDANTSLVAYNIMHDGIPVDPNNPIQTIIDSWGSFDVMFTTTTIDVIGYLSQYNGVNVILIPFDKNGRLSAPSVQHFEKLPETDGPDGPGVDPSRRIRRR